MSLFQRALVFLALGFIIYQARSILTPFIVAAVLAYVLTPLVDILEERLHWRRGWVAGVMYLALLLFIVVIGFALAPLIQQETDMIRTQGNDIIRSTILQLLGTQPIDLLGFQIDPSVVAIGIDRSLRSLLDEPRSAIDAAARAFETGLQVVASLLVLFYFLIDGRKIGAYPLRFLRRDQRAYVSSLALRIHATLLRYLQGQMLLVLLVSVIALIGFYVVFHLPFAIGLAVMTGFLEIIPVIGPAIAMIVVGSVGFAHGGFSLAISVVLFLWVVRLVEDQFVMPQVIGHAVELHPVVTLFAVLVGGALGGILGSLLAVPVAAAIRLLLDDMAIEPPPPASPQPVEVIEVVPESDPDPART